MKIINSFIACLVFIFMSLFAEGQINFTSSNLSNSTLANPTSLQFGPDQRLYVAQQDGTIKIFTIQRNAFNSYAVTATETVLLVKRIPNHYDDGSLKPFNIFTNKRQVTGLYLTGTSANPVIYVCSSDSDIGAGSNGDKNLCTNSGILSKLTWNGSQWQKIDLVRGLPRSEENHAPNGIQIDEANQMLYLAVGGLTNAGSPSKLFAYITEYALSAAVLSIDLKAIELLPVKESASLHPYKYDLPTLDDPTRSNNPDGTDINDPFGGNDGLNQAKVIVGGPVQVFAPGFRNPYDLVYTISPGNSGRMYILDNAANPNWGGYPDQEGPQGTATNNYVAGEPGSLTATATDGVVNNLDGLHKIELAGYTSGSYYGGHPCPVRANPGGAGLYTHDGSLETGIGTFRNSKNDASHPLPSDWPPVPLSMAHPVEGDFQNPGVSNNALLTFSESSNGLCEYTASNFGGALKGDLLAINYDGYIYRIKLGTDGSVLNSKGNKKLNQDTPLASGFGTKGLDITAQGDHQIFPGTIWAVNYASNTITVFEPKAIACAGTYSYVLDDDGDEYSNADEIDNGTDPCSAASKPEDHDLDFISDFNDPDDDNDGLPDTSDPFAIDFKNGMNTSIPITFSLFNNDPGTGFFGLGFTGLMTNTISDYRQLYQKENLVAGGAIGALTIDKVSAGDARGNLNNQEYAFQFGVNVTKDTPPFIVRGVMLGGFFNGNISEDFQSQGIFIGNGDQDNYLKVVLNSNGGNGGVQIVVENGGVIQEYQYSIPQIPGSTAELIIAVDPFTGIVKTKVSLDGGPLFLIGNDIQLAGALLQVVQNSSAMAVGIISTSRNATPFNASWDLLEVIPDPSQTKGEWQYLASSDGSVPLGRHENGFVACGNKFYLMGGRGVKAVNEYDPATKVWKAKAKIPIELSHFQAVSLDNLIYIVGAFTGGYPNETPVPNIYIYDPAADRWIIGPEIPPARRRGSAGVVVYNHKLYIAAGIINGHQSGFVNWLDEYDPATNAWRILTDAPRARDHFNAAVNGNKLYMTGGRRTSGATGQVFNLTVSEVDIYDFATNTWMTNANNLPTPRAGTTTISLEDEIVVIGGESMAHLKAHNETEALNIHSGTWRSLDTLNQGRHATQAIVSNGGIYITGGSSGRGGSAASELISLEEFHLTEKLPPDGMAIVRSALNAPAFIDFASVPQGSSQSDTLPIKSMDGNQAIMIRAIQFRNNKDNLFSFHSPYTVPNFIAPGKKVSIPVTFNSINNLPASAELVIRHSGIGDSTVIVLLANHAVTPPPPLPSAWTPVYFINAGGSAVTAEVKHWVEDSQASPSMYSNYSATFNKANIVSYGGTNTTEAPVSIFNSYRWDGGLRGNPLSNEMQWDFPADSGLYKIELFFAESYQGTSQPGQRVFDIMIEDTIRLDNFDIVSEAGYKNAIKKSFQLNVADGMLDIFFIHEVQNPLINGIAIYKKGATAFASTTPSSLNFGPQSVNTTSSRSVSIKNIGQIPFTISQVGIEGQKASDFKNDFNAPFTLQPGTDRVMNISFKPLSVGVNNAEMKIYSSDLSDTLKVILSGEGKAGSSLIAITQPQNGNVYAFGDSVLMKASVNVGSSPFLKIKGIEGGWRKLKLGYNSSSLYSPKYNVLSGGNQVLEIVLKAASDINWNKIQIRPQGNSAAPLVIANYINNAEVLENGYRKLTIPLSHFDASVDLSQLSLFEFPYSAGAGLFEIHLQSIVFTGGSNPFVWFGKGKTDNIQDGVGGGGQLLAQLVQSFSKTVSKVLFYGNNILLGSDVQEPYEFAWKYPGRGEFALVAKAIFSDGSEEISNPVTMYVSDTMMAGRKTFADDYSEKDVLYRINAGGRSIHSSSDTWSGDSSSGNTYSVRSTGKITLSPSLPPYVPLELFSSERVSDTDSLSWKFPVDKGGEVEVRLYFAETFFNETNKRTFDVAIENSVELSGFDIFAEAGGNTGIVKSFKTISDGTVDINLIRIQHRPAVNGIEIICLNDRCNSKRLLMSDTEWSEKESAVSAYPNPFSNKLNVSFKGNGPDKVLIRVYNGIGESLEEIEIAMSERQDIQIDLSDLPTGVYFMKINTGDEIKETIRIIKH